MFILNWFWDVLSSLGELFSTQLLCALLTVCLVLGNS
jgi:hypothetical protein